jgi:hypothetical protein
MTSVVHVDPGVELSPETNNVQPKPSSPVSEGEEVEPWIAQVKSREGILSLSFIDSCSDVFVRYYQHSWSFKCDHHDEIHTH